jgi:LmbE family N-acetylglucosaminyl deacetylase
MSAPLIVFSPHLDDAVMGCGRVLAAHPGSCVVTLFAGWPRPDAPLTSWDARCGFTSGNQAMRVRRREDAAALVALGAAPRWLGFREVQYGGSEPAAVLARSLREILASHPESTVLLPLGLNDSDHQRARDAVIAARRAGIRVRDWLLYEDALYRVHPGAVGAALRQLSAIGLVVARARLPAASVTRKLTALARYRSQLIPLLEAHGVLFADVLRPERYWRIGP